MQKERLMFTGNPKRYFLVTGESGTGKTHMMHRLAFERSNELRSEKQPVGIVHVLHTAEPRGGSIVQAFAKAAGVRESQLQLFIRKCTCFSNFLQLPVLRYHSSDCM